MTKELTSADLLDVLECQPDLEIAYDHGCRLSYNIGTQQYRVEGRGALVVFEPNPQQAAEAFNRMVSHAR